MQMQKNTFLQARVNGDFAVDVRAPDIKEAFYTNTYKHEFICMRPCHFRSQKILPAIYMHANISEIESTRLAVMFANLIKLLYNCIHICRVVLCTIYIYNSIHVRIEFRIYEATLRTCERLRVCALKMRLNENIKLIAFSAYYSAVTSF